MDIEARLRGPLSMEVEMRVPLSDLDQWYADPIFTRWYPDGEGYSLEVEVEGRTYRMFFDRSCLPSPHEREAEDFSGLWKIEPSSIMVRTTVPHVSEELVEHMHWTLSRADELDEAIRSHAALLVIDLLRGAAAGVNRALAWMRSTKGQFWLEPVPTEGASTLVRHFMTRGRVGSKWFPIDPFKAQVLDAAGRPGNRGITREDWDDLGAWLRTERAPNLVGEILANAEQLEDAGHGRAAIVEAVTAIEMAISRFAAVGRGPEDPRIDVSLAKQVERLGLRNTLRFLLPLVVDVDRVPDRLYQLILEAVDRRNEVVHTGRREIPQGDLTRLLEAAREFCEALSTGE